MIDVEHDVRSICTWYGCNQFTNKDMCDQCKKIMSVIYKAEQTERKRITTILKESFGWSLATPNIIEAINKEIDK